MPNGIPLSALVKGFWRRWSAWQIGLATGFVFLLPSLATIWNMHQQSRDVLSTSIRSDLLSAAKVMATTIDPEVHVTFQKREQEKSEAYLRQVDRILRMRPAVDPEGMIKFVYSCILRNGQIYFVLDDTPEGDADRDGVDDKAHVMEPYADATDVVRRVFAEKSAQVSDVPYTDKWGTFLSAYAPVFGDDHAVVAAVGVDLALTDYLLQLSSLKHVAILSAVGALGLSILAAVSMAKYHRGLMTAFGEQVKLADAATVAARAKSDFLSAMSHELRTPLNAIIGHTTLLKKSASREQIESINDIQQAGDSLLEMITDLLEYAAMDTHSPVLNRKPVRVAVMLNEVLEKMRPLASAKGLELDLKLDAECPKRLMLDASPVRQVIRHLLDNAIKFTSKGKVHLSARFSHEGELHLVVSDTGGGVSEQKRARLFELFDQGDFSSTRQHDGAGIGLAICKRLCEAMQARIDLESSSSEGSIFRVVIPTEVVPSTQKVWLVTKNNLTTILVRSVAEKVHQDLEIVDRPSLVNAAIGDLILVDAGSVDIETMKGNRVVLLNAERGLVGSNDYAAVLTVALKPADVRRVLEAGL